ncbi:SGNH/GDSL hydrolase family protein [Thermodesulfobacteriota bacterium]
MQSRLLLRRLRQVLFFVMVLCIVSVVVAEIGLRPVRLWLINHYGLDRIFLDAGAFKMLFVGDSFTAGGRTESGKGFPEYIEEKLEEKFVPGGRRADVVNIALSGTDTFLHRRRLELYLDRNPVKPDLVFIVTGANNHRSKQMQASYRLSRPDAGITKHLLSALDRSIFLSTLGALAGRIGHDPSGIFQNDFSTTEYRLFVSERFRSELIVMVGMLRDEKIQAVFGTYIRPSDIDQLCLSALLDVSSRYRIPLLTVYSEDLDEEFKREGLYANDLWHPNDRGQKVLAEIFLKLIQDHGLLPDLS